MKCLASILLLAAWSGVAQAQAWPQGPVSIVSSNSPGATPDVVARMVAEALSQSLKQPFVIVNRPGGNTLIATLSVVKARPDGYTLYMGGNTLANSRVVKNMPYDADRDLTPVTMIVDSAPLLIVVHPSVAAGSIPELVKLARAQPGQITYAAAGTLGPILGEILNKTADIRLRQVRYKETTQSVQDTVAGRTHINFVGKSIAIPLLADGKLRVIATAARKRFPLMPDVPALEESYPGISMEGWFVLMAPAGLPKEIGDRMRTALAPWLQRPETLKRLHDLGLSTQGATSEQETRAFIRAERERWDRILDAVGYKPPA